MLQQVPVETRELTDYQDIVGEQEIEAIRQLAEPLKGARVLHVNATPYGGGVAEILTTLVPLMNDVGLDTEWRVIEGDHDFFTVSKLSHNGLQGMDLSISDEMKSIWLENNKQNAYALEGEYDIIVVHDPQPAGMRSMNGDTNAGKWIWRCHLDTSNSNPGFWDFYLPFFNSYDACIFTMEQYVGPGLDGKIAIIRPTIDPLSVKNREIPFDVAQEVVARFGVDTQRPIMTQVSRFDPWKDPLGVIDSYRLVKNKIPDIQLALVGGMATDDPEGWYFLDKTSRRAGEDNDIFILHNFHRLGEFEVGCFQTASNVVLQKSLREGFGLVVTEALWKGQPVIGGNAGGIPLQVLDGETGFLVDSIEETAEKTIYLLTHPEEARVMGATAHEHVRQNFLITKQLKDYLALFAEVSNT